MSQFSRHPSLRFLLKSCLWLFIIGAISASILVTYLSYHLPSVESLKDVQLQVPLRIYTADHKLIAEYGEKRRIPVTLEQTPSLLINAILATEDHRFYRHGGVDWRGLTRAAVHLALTGTKGQGGGTITMQVARNFFLSRRKAYIRKINEILLALKIERELSKQEILELYVNKIFLGHRAYGVAAAAQVYYGKPLNQLTLAEMAMIAGLPKAPSKLNPIANPTAAKARRQHVLERMLRYGYIDQQTFEQANNAPLSAAYHGTTVDVSAPYIAEEVRQTLLSEFGEDAYTKGFQIYTTLDSHLQQIANQQTRETIVNYTQRHGYHGPEGHLDLSDPVNNTPTHWQAALADRPTLGGLQSALVTEVHDQSIDIFLNDGTSTTISWEGLKWARRVIAPLRTGAYPQSATDVARVGDIIRVKTEHNGQYSLAEIPQIEAALVALSPHNGAVLALVGGFDFYKSKFNRALQATRQPGSSFKPFIYSAALHANMTPATLINDAPIVIKDPQSEQLWRPHNDTHTFFGPTRLHTGLIRSRNLVSIRLLQTIGINFAIDFVKRFGFAEQSLPKALSLALGTAEVTPLQLTLGYAIFANGGFKVNPFIIDHIDDSEGHPLFQASPLTACYLCREDQTTENTAPSVITPQNAYLMSYLLKDNIRKGTGRRALTLGRHDLAGKTGTTNDKQDVWFAGFNGDIALTTWLGFDNPQPIGEYASQLALPLWIDFMRQALHQKPENSLATPPNIVTVRIDPKTGLLARSNQKDAIFEKFRSDNAPQQYAPLANAPQPEDNNNTDPSSLF